MNKVYIAIDLKSFYASVECWEDGRVFRIEAVKDFRPAGANHDSLTCGCYTVVIKGEIKYSLCL